MAKGTGIKINVSTGANRTQLFLVLFEFDGNNNMLVSVREKRSLNRWTRTQFCVTQMGAVIDA